LAKQKNEDKEIKLFVPIVREIVIEPPQLKPKRRKAFCFFEEDLNE
jgi:hypothetical protein